MDWQRIYPNTLQRSEGQNEMNQSKDIDWISGREMGEKARVTGGNPQQRDVPLDTAVWKPTGVNLAITFRLSSAAFIYLFIYLL